MNVLARMASDALFPIHSHVGSAPGFGDITPAEMDEVMLQFSAYSGFPKGRVLHEAATEAWARISAEQPNRSTEERA